jgi:diacylglycerol O-acyltransferase / wax synthase
MTPRERERRHLERLSPQDLSNIRVEDSGLPMNIAALVMIGRGDGRGTPPTLGLDALVASVGSRVHLAPRSRQVLRQPRRGLGAPFWADDPEFDVRKHVLCRPIPPPGDEQSLLDLCADLNRPPLDRSQPLWQIWLLTGITGGRSALLIRLHHVLADGAAALELLGSLFDPSGCEPPVAVPEWLPVPVPTQWELAADNLETKLHAIAGGLTWVRHPGELVGRLGGFARQAGRLLHEGLAPRVSLNTPVSGECRLALIRTDLGAVRSAGHRHSGTVNDVLLAAIAAGARSLLAARGELRPGLALKASVAVSLRRAGGSSARPGNQVGVMVVPLPVTEPNAGRLLAQIARATAVRKRQPAYQPDSRVLQRWMVRMMRGQRLVNLLVSDLPGPAQPLSMAGSPVEAIFQIGVVQGNVTISVGAISYAGQLNIDIVADRQAVPDLPLFAAAMSEALGELDAPVRAGA